MFDALNRPFPLPFARPSHITTNLQMDRFFQTNVLCLCSVCLVLQTWSPCHDLRAGFSLQIYFNQKELSWVIVVIRKPLSETRFQSPTSNIKPHQGVAQASHHKPMEWSQWVAARWVAERTWMAAPSVLWIVSIAIKVSYRISFCAELGIPIPDRTTSRFWAIWTIAQREYFSSSRLVDHLKRVVFRWSLVWSKLIVQVIFVVGCLVDRWICWSPFEVCKRMPFLRPILTRSRLVAWLLVLRLASLWLLVCGSSVCVPIALLVVRSR